MADYDTTTWSPDALTTASETTSATLNNATLSGTLTVTGATQLNTSLKVGVNDTGYPVFFYGNTSGKYMKWNHASDELILTDNTKLQLGTDGDCSLYQSGTHAYIVNTTGNLNIYSTTGRLSLGVITADVPIFIGHTSSETTVNDNLTVTGTTQLNSTLTIGADDTGYDVKFFGATSGHYMLWNEGSNALHLVDSTALLIGTGGDMQLYHDGSNSYIKASGTGELRISTLESGKAVTIGHTTSEVTIADNLTITGALTAPNLSGDVAITGDLTVSGNDIKGTGGTAITMDGSNNVTIVGDLTVTGGDIDLSGEASQITLIDNTATALQIGSDGALDLIKINTSDGYAFLEVNGDRSNTGIGTASIITDSSGVMTGNTADGYVGAIELDPAYSSSSSYTITRHNYIKIDNVNLQVNAALTDACIFAFDANAGSHKAVDSGSTHPDIDATDAWVKININGTVHYMPAYTDKS
tara:strand:- start:65 stop:1474 length:1410 start_codon:yes stop_codon:yes gene_type:complete